MGASGVWYLPHYLDFLSIMRAPARATLISGKNAFSNLLIKEHELIRHFKIFYIEKNK